MAIVEFSILIENPESVSALFDRIQIWRSPDQSGSPTPYADITANSATAASISGTIVGPWNLNTLTLTIGLNSAPIQTITFTGTDPLDLQAVIQQINAVLPGLADEAPTNSGKLRITSPVTGTQSALELFGTALTVLGLDGTRVNGKTARPLISPNTESYLFRDFDSLPTYWYKTRYFNSETGALSSFSAPIFAGDGTPISSSSKVTGTLSVADLTGTPVAGIRVIFVPVISQTVEDSGTLYGIFQSVNRIETFTNKDGKITVSLVKGMRIKVFIEGTTFSREFDVPDSDFDILSAAISEPDPFGIVAATPMAIRVS